jgi:hypothetical protein
MLLDLLKKPKPFPMILVFFYISQNCFYTKSHVIRSMDNGTTVGS